MQINVPSALMGAGVAVLTFFAFGFQGFTATPINPPLVIEGIPTPQQMMRVVEGTPFVVPAGKLFVVTALCSEGVDSAGSSSNETKWVKAQFDGVNVLGAYLYRRQSSSTEATGISGAGPFVLPVPPGMVANSGTVVGAASSTSDTDNAVLLGYLADA